MEFKEISKIIKHLEKSTPEKILQLRTILSNDNIEYEKKANNLQEWIQNAPEKITESLQKLYKITEEKDIKQEIIKKEGYIEEKEQEQYTERIEAIYDLINMGLIFASKNEKLKFLQLHIPKDLAQIIMEFCDENPMNKILNLRNLLGGIGAAYGVIEKEEVREIIKKIKPEMLKLFDQYADIINYRGPHFSMGYTNIINKKDGTSQILMMDMLKYDQLKRIINIEGEYKKFTYEEYLKLGEWKY